MPNLSQEEINIRTQKIQIIAKVTQAIISMETSLSNTLLFNTQNLEILPKTMKPILTRIEEIRKELSKWKDELKLLEK